MNSNVGLSAMKVKCFLAAAAALVLFSCEARTTGIILHGWDTLRQTPEEVLANADSFADTSADGVTLTIRRKPSDGRDLSSARLFNGVPWRHGDAEDIIPVFRDIVGKKNLGLSLLNVWIVPKKRLRWNDDAAWAVVETNFSVVARLAKMGGLKGFVIDEEDYSSAFQFYLDPEVDGSFEETAALARKRGAQLFSALYREHPQPILLFFRLLVSEVHYRWVADPAALVRSKGHLWPAFVNGMLDVTPSGVQIVDGNESVGYRGEAADGDFWRSACQQHTAALTLVEPKNRARYRECIRAGFGLYMDSYVIENEKSTWYKGPVDGSRLSHFEDNLKQAAAASDGFLWLYSECKAYVPWNGVQDAKWNRAQTWEQALPGVYDMIDSVKNTQEFVMRRADELRRSGKFTNLIANSCCVGTNMSGQAAFRPGEIPPPYRAWQNPNWRQGVFGLDTSVGEGDLSSLCMTNIDCGFFYVDIPRKVEKGERYGVMVSAKGSNVRADIQWKMKPGVAPLEDTQVHFSKEDGNGWRHVASVVRVPEGAVGMRLSLSVKTWVGRRSDKVWLDNFAVFPLPFDRRTRVAR